MNDNPCSLCPRECQADRSSINLGYCQTDAGFTISSVCVHKGEEPLLGGDKGIINLFFPHCNLQCLYCQNHQISRNETLFFSSPDPDEIIADTKKLIATGIRRIGFVSPSHVLMQVKRLIYELDKEFEDLIYIYNTNGYEKKDLLTTLEKDIDIFLPDLKYMDPDLSESVSGARDYPEVAAKALKTMYAMKGSKLVLDENGLATSGLIIRHLVLPGYIENSLACLRFIAEELSPEVHISLMSQYQPTIMSVNHPTLYRTLKPDEYERVTQEMEKLGFQNGWIQELNSHSHYNPDFNNKEHPFE